MRTAFTLALVSAFFFFSGFAAESVVKQDPDPAKEASLESSPVPSEGRPSEIRKGSARLSTSDKRRVSKAKRSGGTMHPTGSAATGGSSASPGGMQTTPFGNP